ncbi:MAG: MFS transporter [Clostridia bacterium]|nr:MFS transporter [Clostridia bacterium]
MKISANAKKAITLGLLCSVSYLAVYVARNVLGAVTPKMVEGGVFTEEHIGQISSIYFMCYAFGQLINGAIGDKIKARYMISLGLLLAGISNMLFAILADNQFLASLTYGATGFFLAMIYGPMTKVVAENTEPLHATRCSLGYTFASFVGSPGAGLLAAFLSWKSTFVASSVALIAMAVTVFGCFLIFEKKGYVKYGQYKVEKKQGGSIKVLFKHRIVKFALISIITGVVRTSVVFWLTTYISQALSFPSDVAAGIYTAATLVISFTAFASIFIYERVMKHNMDATILLMFSMATVFFILVYLIKTPVVNIALMVLAIMSSNGAASMLWSRYCPSLRDTGMVSGATGFLDFLSYMAAAAANLIFANAVADIGWNNLILVWIALMVAGVIVALPYRSFYARWKQAKERT